MSIYKIVKKRQLPLFIVSGCLGTAIFLSSCGSRQSAAPEERRSHGVASSPATKPPGLNATGDAQPASPSPADNRPVIVTFGDSLTAGVAGRSYPDDLQDLIDAHGLRFRVDNQGVSGDTTTDGLARIENVIAEKPALVVLEFGGNDGLRGIPVDATRKNLQTMIERLNDAHIPAVLLGITLPPNYGPDYVKPFTAMFPDLAKQYKLPFLPFLLLHVYQNQALMQPDGIHPNGEGNKIVAADVFELIQSRLVQIGKHTSAR